MLELYLDASDVLQVTRPVQLQIELELRAAQEPYSHAHRDEEADGSMPSYG